MKTYICIFVAYLLLVSCDGTNKDMNEMSRVSVLSGSRILSFTITGSNIDSVKLDSFPYPVDFDGRFGMGWSYDSRNIAVSVDKGFEQFGTALIDRETGQWKWLLPWTPSPVAIVPWSPSEHKLITFDRPFISDTLGSSVLDTITPSRIFDGETVSLQGYPAEWASATEIYLGGQTYIGTDTAKYEIYKYDFVQDTIVERITDNDIFEEDFRISATGRKITYIAYDQINARSLIHYLDLDDKSVTPMPDWGGPVWSNKGEYLALHKWIESESRYEVYLMNMKDQNRTAILLEGIGIADDINVW